MYEEACVLWNTLEKPELEQETGLPATCALLVALVWGGRGIQGDFLEQWSEACWRLSSSSKRRLPQSRC